MSDPNPNVTGAPDQPAATAAPPKPAAAAAPKPAAKPVAKGKDRRFFLFALVGSWFAGAWTAFAASMGLMTLGTLRFLYPNVLSEPPSKIKVGFADNYEDGKVVERYKDQNTWVVRKDGVIYALSTTCTHLGCTPNWLEREQKFKCPCHGSGYYISGVNFEGPAPRPLERARIVLADDGQILIDKSRHYQQELGQWMDPEAFLKA